MRRPVRTGIPLAEWEQRLIPFLRQRDHAVRDAADPSDLGGMVVIWSRWEQRITSEQRLIQPGVADDLPSLLSALAVETAWPGVTAMPPAQADTAIAVWACAWQVRAQADLRLALYWDPQGEPHLDAVMRPRTGSPYPAMEPEDLRRLLDRMAQRPQTSETPHGYLLAGNRAMEAGEYATARACYAQAVRDLPHHVEAQRNLALADARLGDWTAATAAMRRARALAPQDSELLREYLALETQAGVAAARAGELEAAAAYFLGILREWPQEPTALVNLANIRLREGREREAMAIFRRFLHLHPAHAAADEVRLALAKLDPRPEA